MIEDPKKAHYLTEDECSRKTEELTALQNADQEYMITLRFVKDEHGWYADVPSHTRGQNAMVAGSDKLLDIVADGHTELSVRFRFVKSEQRSPVFTLRRISDSHSLGSMYLVSGLTMIPFPAYICAVGHDVYGNAPKRIYVYGIDKGKPSSTPKETVDPDPAG